MDDNAVASIGFLVCLLAIIIGFVVYWAIEKIINKIHKKR